MIGHSIVGIDHNDITIDTEKYTGTHGLWRLLTYKDASDNIYYTQDDLKNYIKILFCTESIYKNSDQITGKPKSSQGDKYSGTRLHEMTGTSCFSVSYTHLDVYKRQIRNYVLRK